MSGPRDQLFEDIQVLEEALLSSQSRARHSELQMTQMEREYKELIVQFQKYKEKVYLLLHAMETSNSVDAYEKSETIQILQDQLNIHSLEIRKTRENILAKTIIYVQDIRSSRRLKHGIMFFFDKFEEFIVRLLSTIYRAIKSTLGSIFIFFQLEKCDEMQDEMLFPTFCKFY
jgi:hypothetical protein